MPDAAPVTSAVLPDRSPMEPCGSLDGRGRACVRRGHADCGGSARLLAEQDAALHLVLLLRLDERHHHGTGLDLVVLHHRLGDVLHQGALLIERAPAERIDDDFWHVVAPCLPNGSKYGTTGTFVQAASGRPRPVV